MDFSELPDLNVEYELQFRQVVTRYGGECEASRSFRPAELGPVEH